MIGTFPIVIRKRKFIILIIDNFIKWIEIESLIIITYQKVTNFLYKSIIWKYEISCVIINNNGKWFDSKRFKEFCVDLGIEIRFSSRAYPWTNWLAKLVNKIILQVLKKKSWMNLRDCGSKNSLKLYRRIGKYIRIQQMRPFSSYPLVWLCFF